MGTYLQQKNKWLQVIPPPDESLYVFLIPDLVYGVLAFPEIDTSETPLGVFFSKAPRMLAAGIYRVYQRPAKLEQNFRNMDFKCQLTPARPHLVLIDAPYPDDGVSAGCEKSVQGGVQLQGIDSISIVLLHFISNNIGNLTSESTFAFYEVTEHAIKCSLLAADRKFKTPFSNIKFIFQSNKNFTLLYKTVKS